MIHSRRIPILKGVNLAPYLRYARLGLVFALVPAVIAGAVAYARASHGITTYDASATLYVDQSSQANLGFTGLPDVYTSTQLAQTYSALATQPVVAQTADRLLAARYPGYRVEDHNLRSAPSSTQDQTPLIVLTVTDLVPARAVDAVNASAQAFIQQIKQLNQSRFATHERSLAIALQKETATINRLTSQLATYSGSNAGRQNLQALLNAHQTTYQSLLTSQEQLKLARDETSTSVDIYSPATLPASPNVPHPSRTAILWAFLALLVGCGGIYAYEYLNDLPRDPEDVATAAEAPTLGTIPAVDGTGPQPASLVRSPRSAVAEAYRQIRTNIQFADIDHPPQVIVVTSPSPGEGKTTTASNLALVFAKGGMSVTLIDTDLRRPTVQRLFPQTANEGLTGRLLNAEMDGSLVPVEGIPTLSIIPSGPLPPNPADLLDSHRMQELLQHLKARTELIILDSPPVLSVTDAAILAAISDGVVLVVDPNSTHLREVRAAREAIAAVGARVIGVVVNRAKGGGTFSRYSGYYSYGYGPTEGNRPARTSGADGHAADLSGVPGGRSAG